MVLAIRYHWTSLRSVEVLLQNSVYSVKKCSIRDITIIGAVPSQVYWVNLALRG